MIFGLALNVGEGLDEARKISSLIVGSKISRVWVSYTLRGRDPFEVASAAATANNGLRIGIGTLSPYIYTANEIKSRMIELVGSYGERFDLCLGLGDRRVLEDLGHKISHSTFLTILTSTLRSLKDDLSRQGVKIWLGAQGSRTLTLTEHFDSVLLNHSNLKSVRWALEKMGPSKEGKEIGISAPSYIYEEFEEEMFAYLRKAALKILLGATKALARDLNLEAEYQRALSHLKSVPQKGDEAKIASEDLIKSLTITMHRAALPNYIRAMSELGVTEVVFGYPLSVSLKHVQMLKSTLETIT